MGRLTGLAQQFKHLSYGSNEGCETSIRHSELALRTLTDGDADALVIDGTLAREVSSELIGAYASPGSRRRIENSRHFPSTKALSGRDGKEQFDDTRPGSGLCKKIAEHQKMRREKRRRGRLQQAKGERQTSESEGHASERVRQSCKRERHSSKRERHSSKRERSAAVAASILRPRKRILSHRAKTREYNPLTASNLAALSAEYGELDESAVSWKNGVSRALESFSEDDSDDHSWNPHAASDKEEDEKEERSSVDSDSTSASAAAIAIASTVSQAIRVGADTAINIVKKPVNVVRNYRSKSLDTEDTAASSMASPISQSGRKGLSKAKGFFRLRHSSLVVKFLDKELDLSKFFSNDGWDEHDVSEGKETPTESSANHESFGDGNSASDSEVGAPVHVPRSRPSLSYSRSARPNSLLLQTRQVECLNLKRFIIVPDEAAQHDDGDEDFLHDGDSLTGDGDGPRVEIRWDSSMLPPPPPPSSPDGFRSLAGSRTGCSSFEHKSPEFSFTPSSPSCRSGRSSPYGAYQERKVLASSGLEGIGEASDEERSDTSEDDDDWDDDDLSEECSQDAVVEIEYDGVTGNVSVEESRAFLAEQLEILATKPSYLFLATRQEVSADSEASGIADDYIASNEMEEAEGTKYDEQVEAPTEEESGVGNKVETDLGNPFNKVVGTKPQRRRSRRRSSKRSSGTMIMKFPSEALGSVSDESDDDDDDTKVAGRGDVVCLVLEQNLEASLESSSDDNQNNEEMMVHDEFSTLVLKVANINKFIKLLKKRRQQAEAIHSKDSEEETRV